MKANRLDFLFCGSAISLLIALTVGTLLLVLPITKHLASEYHVVVDFFVGLLLYGLFSSGLVHLLLRIFPSRPGEYSLDSLEFNYWKLLTIVYRLGEGALLPFTPVFVKPVIEVLFGARVGSGVAMGGTIDDPYMVTIGDGAVLGHASLIAGSMLHGGVFTCGPVKIGAGATIGVNSVILPNTEIGDNATLLGGSYVMPGTKIPAGETWRGNPARKWM